MLYGFLLLDKTLKNQLDYSCPFFSLYLYCSLLNSHFLKFSVSLNRCFIDLQLSTMMMYLLPLNSMQLARHGPAVVVTPVFIPK